MSNKNIPVLILQNIVLFPSTEITLELDKESINQLIKNSENYFDSEILIVNKEDILEENPDFDDLLDIGVLSKIVDTLNLPNGKIRIVFSGIRRVKIDNYYREDNALHAKYSNILIDEADTKTEIAYLRLLKNMLEEYLTVSPYNIININTISNINDLDILTDAIAATMDFNIVKKEEYLLEIDVIKRAKMLIDDIKQDLEIAIIERKIDDDVSIKIDKDQREVYLREKISVIKNELGDTDENEINSIKEKMNSLDLPENIKTKLNNEIKKLESYSSFQPETGPIKTYIDLVLSLPWNKYDNEEEDIKKIEKSLNESHYGLEEVKTRILDYIAVRKYAKNSNSPIICLVGPPGVGKTTLAISIAEALNRHYAKISVGGIDDEADIVGHRRTYIGALPGMIINGIKKAGVTNPVFIIDEIDKMNKNIKGDPASSLLEVLDKEQNSHFIDHYLEEEYDLSDVLFITTANYIENIPAELVDRLEIIEVSSYSKYEKFNIAKDYLIKKHIEDYELKKIEFKDMAINYLIDNYTLESGVRELDRKIDTILRKIVRKRVDKNNSKIIVDNDLVIELLGDKTVNDYKDINDPGIVNGLSYTPYGGDVLKIETVMYKGEEKINLTGSLGDVIKESCMIAISYIKSNANLFGISKDCFKNKSIHIHFPEGAIKKDGPSAGCAITTCLLSILLNKKVPNNIAMTGEITLHGNVLAIGGVREKVIGAKNKGITTIILPKENKKDVKKLDDDITKDLLFIYVEDYYEIFKVIFKPKVKQKFDEENLIKLNI